MTIYDEDGLRLAATMPPSTPARAFEEAGKIVDIGSRDQKIRNRREYAWPRSTVGLVDSLAEITADCSKKQTGNMGDRCAPRGAMICHGSCYPRGRTKAMDQDGLHLPISKYRSSG